MNKRIALIPCFEPDEHLGKLVYDLLKNSFEVVVVNDGSSSKNLHYFVELPDNVHFLSYDINQGKGHALKYGLRYIRNNFTKGAVIVTMDADGQHKLSDAARLCDLVEKNPKDVALGMRVLDKTAPLKSRVGNSFARTSFSMFAKLNVYDTQTGLRAFSYDLINFLLKVPGERYEYEMNMLMYCAREKINLKELRIETVYIDHNKGSHYNPFKDTIRIIKEIAKFSISSIIAFLIDYALYSALNLIPTGIGEWVLIANILARIVSASINFTINYRLVFNSKKKLSHALGEYAGLAILNLGINTGLLFVATKFLSINKFLAKLLIEVVLFISSWLIQRLFIFRKKKAE